MPETAARIAPAAAIAAATILGLAAWGEGRQPAVAVVLPLVVAACHNRRMAWATAAIYTALVLRHHPAFIARWFDDNQLVGWLAVGAYAAISATVWASAWSNAHSPAKRAAVMVGVMMVSVLPPMALAIPGHPVVGLGYLLPGLGWSGLALWLGAVAAWAAIWRPRAAGTSTAPLMIAILAAAAAYAIPSTAERAPVAPASVQAMQTHWGGLQGPHETLRRIELMGVETRRAEPGSVLVWPESVLGLYDRATDPVMAVEVVRPSREKRMTQIIGLDIEDSGGGYRNAAKILHPDGRVEVINARQPAPVSLWRPWSETQSFHADWSQTNVVQLQNGMTAALMFCYEEYIPALFLLSAARERVDIFIVMTNTWAAVDRRAAAIQSQHTAGIVALLGTPFVKAENH